MEVHVIANAASASAATVATTIRGSEPAGLGCRAAIFWEPDGLSFVDSSKTSPGGVSACRSGNSSEESMTSPPI